MKDWLYEVPSPVQHGVIDGYRIMVNPVIPGAGTPVFKGIKDSLGLRLLEVVVLVHAR